jgi:hypothetical protein
MEIVQSLIFEKNSSWFAIDSIFTRFSLVRNFIVLDPEQISRFIAKYRVFDRTSPNLQDGNSMQARIT